MANINKKNNGFSLIELIVVITIIMIVSAIAVMNFAAANAKSRDGRRTADLEKIRQALEFYKEAVGTYPAALASLVPAYVQALPADPQPTKYVYVYTRGVTAYTYTLDAYLEVVGGASVGTDCAAADIGDGIGDGATDCNYRVNNP